MTTLTSLLHPLAVPRLLLRAADDLSALADVARREPHPVDALEQVVGDTRRDLQATLGELRRAVASMERLRSTATTLDTDARNLVDGGRDLLEGVRALDARAAEVVVGGRDLVETGRDLDDRLERLEQSAETVADTVEPLQGAAQRVGRIAGRGRIRAS